MKVAFDVMGTLIGEQNETKAVKLFKALAALDCYMMIWSGGGRDLAIQAVKQHHLKDLCRWVGVKRYITNLDEEPEVDLAIDDELVARSALCARKIVLCNEIPEDDEAIQEFAEQLVRDHEDWIEEQIMNAEHEKKWNGPAWDGE